MSIITKLFGTHSEREVKRIIGTVDKIEALRPQMIALSDEELQGKTREFKKRLSEGETLDDLLPEAYATVREAARRVLDMEHYRVQLIGGVILHQGRIAEMRTGEGKTLVSTLPAYLNALEGKGVHIVTVNDYLAERDAQWMGKVHEFLGLKVGVVLNPMKNDERREQYACDITYITNNELGFDYLRDNMVTDVKDRVLRGLNFALVDEVDSILIDESRTPLIISGGQKQTANMYLQADRFVKRLKVDEDYEIDVRAKTVQLSEAGVAKAERVFRIENLYNLAHTPLLHHINQALRANYIMEKDVDYVVDENDDEIVIVDPNTGRMMKGRQWSDGLHQAVEAKEGISIKQETTTLATITYQNFFRLYNRLAGMTGTAKTEEEEFLEIYNMYVVEIPTNRPVARIDYPDAVYGTKKAKYKALVDEVVERHATGQPILVGTIAVETSELLSKYLKERKIPHNVLNAKNNEREAEIIARAGQKGAVTIATNMAGRGTDIKLGEGVRELGGLCVLGSERHESRRIDNQLRGRSGRQGDPGMSRFYVSVEDDLMKRFGSERMEGLFASLGDTAVESKTVTKSISSAQRRVEGVNYDARKQLLQYDDVMRQQRETMYEQRDFILENEDVHTVINDMFRRVISDTVSAYVDHESRNQDVDCEGLIKALNEMGFKEMVKVEDIQGKNAEAVISYVQDLAWNYYEKKVEPVQDRIRKIEKDVSLQLIDRAWSNHIDTMDKLRNGIGLRGYASKNPLEAYASEGYQLFQDMMSVISRDIVSFCMNVRVVPQSQAPREA